MAIMAQSPDILGERHSSQDVRTQNVMACQAVANIVKSSLEPIGLDKFFLLFFSTESTRSNARKLKLLPVRSSSGHESSCRSGKPSLGSFELKEGVTCSEA
ncbi:T-complex protein 1 subunit alpha [Ananas comosus]|uniref:T-complex protein 1 subunit alpha n=1 Tax=Ananas comosus TaxID=4615 RepID=A0A199W8M6_ANACO|nr:T-complex protein 1 subunit alpha [Ananas comosus]